MDGHQFTTTVGVDEKTIEQLKVSVLTWKRFAPELWINPLVVFFDRDALSPSDVMFVEHRSMRIVPWPPDGCHYESQREKMLCGFVHVARVVDTPWMLKLDTDAIKTDARPWILDEWFKPVTIGGELLLPAFVGNRWGYTKPADQMSQLDDWADRVSDLAGYPRLDLPYDPGARTCRHPGGRLASWITFFHTEWAKMVASYCVLGTIPVPSEDGYHFYCAKRRGDPYRLVKFKRHGWTNVPKFPRLLAKVQEVMR